ncbi:MAG: hypothetical protein ACXVZ2_15035 [Gaiellaceae bacterium]
MRIRTTPLLCELHAHTTWSDGVLGLPELVDLYGRSGFDVLAVTDHTVRTDEDGDEGGPRHIHAANYAAYLDAIRSETERARAEYDLLLLPGSSSPTTTSTRHSAPMGSRSASSASWGSTSGSTSRSSGRAGRGRR